LDRPHNSKERIRVIQVVAPAAFGGLERVVAGLTRGLADRGHEVHVISIFDAGGRVHPLRLPDSTGAVRHTLEIPRRRYDREVAEVRRLCQRIGRSVIHTHGYRPDVIDGPWLGPKKYPYVSTVHGFTGGGTKNRLFEWLQVRSYRGFDAVVAVSGALRQQLANSGVPHAKLETIPNAWPGNDAPMLSRREARERLGVPSDLPVIGWVGRLSLEKGPDVFVKALAHLNDKPWLAAVLGTGAAGSTLRDIAIASGVSDRINWCGNVAEAGTYFRAFDLFVLSSRTEGTPIALLEAMAAGVPVVATAVGGVPDVLGSDGGILVRSEDAGGLAAAMTMMLDNPDRAKSYVDVATSRLQTNFSRAVWIDSYERLYHRILAR
jgi:glycosyltransferase involved in cell wall biosynthesis